MPENKPVLSVKQVSYFQVDYQEIIRFVCEVYGISYYELVSSEEWHNDSQHRIKVCKEKLNRWELEKLETLKAGRQPSYSLRAVMTDLCNQDLIEPGDYLIDVCW